MNRWRQSDSLRTRLLRWVSFLLPAVLFLSILQGPGLGFAKLNLQRRIELDGWKKNVYEEAWLDSTETSLLRNRDLLANLDEKVESRILPDTLAVETLIDSLRAEAQALGCEVSSLSPSRDSSGNMKRLRLRMELRSAFGPAMQWFQRLGQKHPGAYVEEALLRSDSRGKVEINLTLLFHGRMGR